MKKAFLLFTGLTLATIVSAQLKTLGIKTSADTYSFFKYEMSKTVVSGHRGSHIAGYPENAIETFEHVLKHTPAFFEIDPRLTKDSVIVLLHDATLDRTTTGKGKLSDHTWEEVKQFRLKDKDGNITPYRIPTLQEAINWAKGKTILNLDRKDVPPQMTAEIIRKNNAAAFVMVTVHTADQAKFFYQNNPLIMMSAFVKTEEALKSYEAAGVPWKNMIAYIGSENKPENKVMLDLLHARGVMCMISAAPVYDKLATKEERAAAYRDIFAKGADILESDYPIEVGEAIKL
ncbi:glycerophosphodiester phosphodiesterase family protein [Terrimonas sp. NA20]|uniref:Glycerophosphodiester phosphodiesterase family protein n=1 Tax=Terrimonas ginsenosidimutans TaxID=2908004 RepID=A0ABS9KRA2_9BACT|nr:glycerophosphodiester phosphodiesterase family protein [Terrimonas ginsenosidimutans]MCG2614846.1 glycerophosphodiester phosphodiesterase family protein [Terrimonas ginsenosidimutans]